MNSIQKILAPVDFSGLSADALRYAVRLAGCSGARVTALYAELFQPPPYFAESGLEQLNRQLRAAKENAHAYLGKFIAAEAPGADAIDGIVREGLPADAIQQVAAELPADLIVMGTHGRSGFNRLMLGSVTERVLRDARVPVLAVRESWKGAGIRRIVCPVNNSREARSALSAAASLAKCSGAELTVLHVREPGAEASIEDLCSWVPEDLRNSCSVKQLHSEGDVARAVIAFASETEADLLVLGARHRPFFDSTVLGVNTIRILRHAPTPVLAVFGGEEHP